MPQCNNNTKTKKFKHLIYVQRAQIEALLKANISKVKIASIVGISRATLYRELKRGTVTQKNSDWTYRTQYFSDVGQNRYETNRIHSHRKSLRSHYQTQINALKDLMKLNKWSIGAAYSQMKPFLCLKTLYNYLKKDKKRRTKSHKVRRNLTHLGRSIELRPKSVETREEFGNYEADTIVSGKNLKGALLTVIERKTRAGYIIKLQEKTSTEVIKAFKTLNIPIKSITTDNGSEFAGLENALQIPVFYTHPFSSWEKGSIERFNGLIRRFIPKGSDISKISTDKIFEIEQYFNSLPRKIIDWQTPKEFFQKCLICSCN